MTRPGAAYFESGAATQRVQLSLMDHVTGHNDNQRTKGRCLLLLQALRYYIQGPQTQNVPFKTMDTPRSKRKKCQAK